MGPRDIDPTFGRITASPIVAIGATAVLYFFAARVALLFAIPPGYATAIWPAAGLALASVLVFGNRALVGVFFGSAFANLGTSLGALPNTLGPIALVSAIGLGAALQAGAGAFLLRRIGRFPQSIGRERFAFYYCALGGPLACLASATIGVSALYVAGLTSAGDVAYTWVTWWSGDGIGVLAVLPLTLAWMTSRSERGVRLAPIAVPLVALFVFVTLVNARVTSWERERLQRDFERRASVLAVAVDRSLIECFETAEATASYFAAAGEVDRPAFERFVSSALQRHRWIRAFEWCPRVPHEERPAFEADLSDDYGSGTINVRAIGGELATQDRAGHYFPIRFVAPHGDNEGAVGFDVSSEPDRREALDRSLATRTPAMTGPVRLVQEARTSAAFLVFAPVQGSVRADTAPEPPLGVALVVVHVADLIDAALADLDRSGIDVAVHDAGNPDAGLYGPPVDPARDPSWKRVLAAGGRSWELHFSATPLAYAGVHPWQSWIALAGTFVLTGLLGTVLLEMASRNLQIQRAIDDHTREIRAANDALDAKNRELDAKNRELDQTNRELARSNKDLEQFAYIAAHDLREPLRKIASFVGILRKDYGHAFDETAEGYMSMAIEGATRMQRLLSDLLTYSRLGLEYSGRAAVNASEVMDDVSSVLSGTIEETGARVTADPLPVVYVDEEQLYQVLLNLVSNAIRFQGEEPPVVHVSARLDENEHVFSVRDNGIGIEPQYHERVFQMFKRLHSKDAYPGSGIGLAIVKAVVERHQGRVWIESERGAGTTVYFSLPDASSEDMKRAV